MFFFYIYIYICNFFCLLFFIFIYFFNSFQRIFRQVFPPPPMAPMQVDRSDEKSIRNEMNVKTCQDRRSSRRKPQEATSRYDAEARETTATLHVKAPGKNESLFFSPGFCLSAIFLPRCLSYLAAAHHLSSLARLHERPLERN